MADTQTLPKMAVSTAGFQGNFYGTAGYVDPFGLNTERFKVYEGKRVVHGLTTFKDVSCLLNARRNQYAHSRPAFGEIEYYEVPEAPELSADIAPESPLPAKVEVPDAVRDVLVTFYFERMTAGLSGDDTRPLLPPITSAWRESNLRSGRWIVQKKKDVTEINSFLEALLKLRKRGRLPAMTRSVAALLADLDSFAGLEMGWNSYSAPAPTAAAIENAKVLVGEAGVGDTIPDRVEPSAMGGVGVAFAAGTREVVVEFYNNGTAHALFADNATEVMDTQSVKPTVDGYRSFLVEVRQYLYGHQPVAQARRPSVSRF